jgi:hypothetical protein
VKTKVLIASILLSLTAIVLVCYFVGCQERPATTLQQPADKMSEKPVLADDSKKPDSELQLKVESSTTPSTPQQVAPEDESHLSTQQTIVKADKAEFTDSPTVLGPTITPLPEADTQPQSQQDISFSMKPKSEERTRVQVIRGQVSAPADKLAGGGMMDGRSDVTYEMNDDVDDRYVGTGRAGGMGGMGGYGGGMTGVIRHFGIERQPASVSSTISRARGSGFEAIKLMPDRRMPAELLNVSADEIWVIAKAETQAVPVDEDTPGSGAMLAKLPEEEKEIPLPLKHTMRRSRRSMCFRCRRTPPSTSLL